MAVYSGTAGSVVSYGTAGTVIGELDEWTLDLSADEIESSAFGNSWKDFIAGPKEASGTFSGGSDPANVQQALMWTSFIAGTTVGLRLYQDATVFWNVGTALITGLSPTTSFAGRATTQYAFRAKLTVGTA